MKCPGCGFENRDDAKFCTKCGKSLIQKVVQNPVEEKSNNSKYIIIALVVVIILLVAAIGYFAFNMNSNNDNSIENASSSQASQSSQEASSSQKAPLQAALAMKC